MTGKWTTQTVLEWVRLRGSRQGSSRSTQIKGLSSPGHQCGGHVFQGTSHWRSWPNPESQQPGWSLPVKPHSGAKRKRPWKNTESLRFEHVQEKCIWPVVAPAYNPFPFFSSNAPSFKFSLTSSATPGMSTDLGLTNLTLFSTGHGDWLKNDHRTDISHLPLTQVNSPALYTLLCAPRGWPVWTSPGCSLVF